MATVKKRTDIMIDDFIFNYEGFSLYFKRKLKHCLNKDILQDKDNANINLLVDYIHIGHNKEKIRKREILNFYFKTKKGYGLVYNIVSVNEILTDIEVYKLLED